ncbi:hypothetical protein [Spirosoma linguale]|uniref:Uncharacterized protein n=1 Tax=Spirosoma linguale (strain ATCC 33905 / DSM 74 / LMG 10896 / Claus 1) TaxID=504472 RepID=D2QJ76_SPILD|nr:hypothetical protein Slin_2774 [Spirosoma linguale DSM 74]
MPNSQRLFNNRAHVVSGPDMNRFMENFLNNTYQKLMSDKKEIVAY